MKLLSNLKSTFTSPITYAGAGYLAALGSLLAQDAVIRGDLVPGSITSNTLACLLIPPTALGPAVGALLGFRYFRRGIRLTESVLGMIGAAPLLALWALVLIRVFKHHLLAT